MLVTMAIIGLQVQERGVALVGLGHQVLARAEPRVGAGALEAAADHEGRILAAFGEDRRHEAGGGGLAVRAGHRDGVAEAHELAEHLGARHHRDALAPAPPPLRGFPRDTALEITTTSASPTFCAAWPMTIARAELRQALGHGVGLEVAALHFVAEIDQHFGDAAHATAADADEVDAMDAAHAVAHAASMLLDSRRPPAASAACGRATSARALGHGQ